MSVVMAVMVTAVRGVDVVRRRNRIVSYRIGREWTRVHEFEQARH